MQTTNWVPLFPEQASTFAWQVDALYFYLVAVSIAFSIPIVLAIFVFGMKYREREKYVILTNDNGEVVRRFPNSDRTSDRKKALDAQVNPAPAAAAGPGGGTAPQPAPPPRTPSVAPGQRAGVLPRGGG